jgi:hypothetical protein
MGSEHRRRERAADKALQREQRKSERKPSTMNPLSTLLARNAKPWTKPSFEMPMLMPESELDPLGQFSGVSWFEHRKYGELSEEPRELTDRDILPSALLCEYRDEEGERRYRVFKVHEPGTLERLKSMPIRKPKPPPAAKPVDALALTWLGRRLPEQIVVGRGHERSMPIGLGPETSFAMKPSKPAPRGPEAVLERLAAKHTEVVVANGRLVPVCPGGVPPAGVLELLEASEPLVLPYKRDGKAPDCLVTAHKTPTLAVTVAVGGVPWCGECVPS